MRNNNKILCLYSGGTDSTLVAVLAAKKVNTVYLVTYERFGLFSSKRSEHNIPKLKKKFPQTKFIHLIESIEKEYKQLSCHNRFSDLLKFGFIQLSVCGLCKMAMHWKTIELCKKYDIKVVYDGSIKASKIFPAQNKDIMINEMIKIYREQGISYDVPVYNIDTEQMLFKEKLTASKKLKNTHKDIQPTCSQQLLFSRFVNYYLSKYSFEEYEKRLKKYYKKKMNFLRRKLQHV